MSDKLVLASIGQFAQIANKFPAILSIPAFSTIKPIIEQSKSQKGCSCNGNKALIDSRPQFEAAMSVLTDAEKERFKAITNVKQICFFRKNPNGSINSTCF